MPDGSVKYLHVLARGLETSPGSLEYVGALTDVTAAKQAEKTLRESEAYLAEAQRLSHIGSWAWTPAIGDIRYWSEVGGGQLFSSPCPARLRPMYDKRG
jgi:PAS domain-containing protein